MEHLDPNLAATLVSVLLAAWQVYLARRQGANRRRSRPKSRIENRLSRLLKRGKRVKVAGPPALTLRRTVGLLTTQKGFREVFEPTFADMDEEYFGALSRKEHFEAWKIVIAYHWKVGMLIAMRPVVRALATVQGWMKVG